MKHTLRILDLALAGLLLGGAPAFGAGNPASIAVSGANPQSAYIKGGIQGGFTQKLYVTVKDASGDYVNNVSVSFSAPTSGPSALLGPMG